MNVSRWLEIHEKRAAGFGLLLGSTVEMGPGTLAQLHLAASVRDLTLPSDLIGPAMYADDVLKTPLCYRSSCLAVPEAIGIGGQIDRRKLVEMSQVNLRDRRPGDSKQQGC